MNAYLKQVLTCTAVACLLLVVVITPVTAQASGTYPATGGFNGMTIQYTISGVTVNNTTDVSDFTTSRTLTGTVDPGASVHVSGTFSMTSGLYADCSVTVSGAKTQTYHLDVGQSKSFSIDAPAQTDVSVSISMGGTYGSAAEGESRGLTVHGTFAGKSSEGGGGGVSIPLNDAAALSAAAAAVGTATAVVVVGGLGAVAAAAGTMADSRKKDGDDDDQGPIGYILQITKDQLLVAPMQDDSFVATVYKVDRDDSKSIDFESEMSIDSYGAVTVIPPTGKGESRFTVRQSEAATESPVKLTLVASAGGTTASHIITVELAKPVLEAAPTELKLLAFPNKTVGREAKTTAEVVLTLRDVRGWEGDWNFKLTPSDADVVTVSDPAVEHTYTDDRRASFTISVANPIEKPAARVGPDAWHRSVTLHSAASLAEQEIDGPNVTVIVCFEGLFVERVWTVDEHGAYQDFSKTEVNLRIDSPDKDPLRTAKVKFAAMVWDGTDVRDDPDTWDQTAVNGPKIVSDLAFSSPPECTEGGDKVTCNGIFTALKARLKWEYNADEGSGRFFRTWSVELDQTIPGKGEQAHGTVHVSSNINSSDVMSMDLPIVLQLGQREGQAMKYEEERKRCDRMIQNCIPKDQRQPLFDQMNQLPHKGALDYRMFAVKIYETAWKIWHEQQKDYQYWESGWGLYLIEGLEAQKSVTDLAFQMVVGFYAEIVMGDPSLAFAASLIVPSLKDEALAFYAYYIEHGAGRDIETIGREYVADNLTKFLKGYTKLGIETYILKDFRITNILKDKTGKALMALAYLFIWKFTFHLANDRDQDGDKGMVSALVEATKEVSTLVTYSLLQEFVWAHKDDNLTELYKEVKARGVFGPPPNLGPVEDPYFLQEAKEVNFGTFGEFNKRNMENLCEKYNVEITLTGFGDPYALIAGGKANPKGEPIKPMTMNEDDIRMGMGSSMADKGLVALKKPPEESELVQDENMTPKQWEARKKRRAERAEEYDDRLPEIQKLVDEQKVVWDSDTTGLIYERLKNGEDGSVSRGLPFGSDNDVLCVLDRTTGEPLTGAKYDALIEEGKVWGLWEHGALYNWDKSQSAHRYPDARTFERVMAKVQDKSLPTCKGTNSWVNKRVVSAEPTKK